MKTMQCAICRENQETEILYEESIDFAKVDKKTFSARRTPEKVHYRLLRCRNCGLIISSPILPAEKIKLLYKQSAVTYQEEIPGLKKTYGDYLKKTLPYLPENPKLLEIGSGNGFFLEKARELGVADVFGVEPGKEAVASARDDLKKRILIDFFPTPKIQPLSFDIICVFQTLDHVIDPDRFLKECHKALKKEGIVLAIVHDSAGFSVKLLGENSPIFDIEHIYLFNKKNLEMIFAKNGFTILDIFSVKNTYPLSYWIRMFPVPSLIKNNILQLVKILGISKLDITLSPGNIGIIAKKNNL